MGNHCGPGCRCQGTTNLTVDTSMEDDYMNKEDSLHELERSDLSGYEDEEEDENISIQSEVHVITDTFGNFIGRLPHAGIV